MKKFIILSMIYAIVSSVVADDVVIYNGTSGSLAFSVYYKGARTVAMTRYCSGKSRRLAANSKQVVSNKCEVNGVGFHSPSHNRWFNTHKNIPGSAYFVVAMRPDGSFASEFGPISKHLGGEDIIGDFKKRLKIRRTTG